MNMLSARLQVFCAFHNIHRKFGIWSKFWGTCLRLCYFIFLFLFVFKSCQVSFLPFFCLFHMSPNWSSVRDFEEDKELARLVEWLNLWSDQQKKVSHASRVHYLAEVLPLRKFCGGVCRCFSFHYLARGEKPVLALRRASLSFWHVQDQHQLFRGVASFIFYFFFPSSAERLLKVPGLIQTAAAYSCWCNYLHHCHEDWFRKIFFFFSVTHWPQFQLVMVSLGTEYAIVWHH